MAQVRLPGVASLPGQASVGLRWIVQPPVPRLTDTAPRTTRLDSAGRSALNFSTSWASAFPSEATGTPLRIPIRIAIRYAQRMAQFVTRVDGMLAAEIDRLVSDGVVPSRSAAVRLGLERLVERHRRGQIGQAIVDGYTRRPQTDTEVGWADEATSRMIAEESW